MQTIFIFLFLTLLFPLLVILRAPSRNKHLDELEKLEKEKQNLLQQINKLKQQTQNNQINKSTLLPNQTNEVLDIYEQSNISIPADIIESLATITFDSIDDTFNFIENQRHHWKLENTKKVYRR